MCHCFMFLIEPLLLPSSRHHLLKYHCVPFLCSDGWMRSQGHACLSTAKPGGAGQLRLHCASWSRQPKPVARAQKGSKREQSASTRSSHRPCNCSSRGGLCVSRIGLHQSFLVPQQKEVNHWRRRLAWLSSVAQVLWVIELVSIAERSDYLMTSLHRDMCQPDSGRVGAVNARSERSSFYEACGRSLEVARSAGAMPWVRAQLGQR